MIDLRNTALAPLTHYPQWVTWRIEDRSGKPTKVPYSSRTGHGASSVNPADWATYDEAAKYAAAHGMAGVGFVLTASDPFYCLDLDACLIDGAWSPTAVEMWSHMGDQVAAELSQSGRGLHMWGMYDPAAARAHKQRIDGRELYTDKRFMAVTGNMVGPGQMTDYDRLFAWLVSTHFAPDAQSLAAPFGWTDRPVDEWFGPEDDEELLAKALRSQSVGSAFNGDPCFSDLWMRNVDVLAKRWPPESPGQDFNASRADGSLAASLAFWTGKDCGRIERLMRRSALARDKWDDHGSYLRNTILGACGKTSKVLGQDAKREAPAPVEVAEPEDGKSHARDYRGQYVRSQVMSQIFDEYVFVHGVDKILTRDGKLLGKTGFDQEHNGPQYLPSEDGKKVVSSAWDALRDSQHFRLPAVDGMCFRPEQPDRIIEDGRRLLVNMYRRPKLRLVEGDPSKLLDHMKRMLPHGNDLELFLSYFAFCAQNPGEKVQWWPIIVGAKGAFKSTWTEIMKRAVGAEYVHDVNSKQLVEGSSNFNGWIENKLFLGVDDIHGKDRREFLEHFKPTVTNRSIPIEAKGREQVTGDNRANGLMTANDPSDVPIEKGERRYAPFFYAYLDAPEMWAAGMDSKYLGDIHSWLVGEKQYAHLGRDYGFNVVAHYLHTRPIAAEFNKVVAPETTATLVAIDAGLGPLEQAVQELIDQDEVGFAGGWASSNYLNMFFDRRRDKITPRRRDQIMKRLGYAPHPKMNRLGTTDNRVMPDNKKVKLYCKINSIAWNNLDSMTAVCAAYTKAQSVAAGDATAAAFNG